MNPFQQGAIAAAVVGLILGVSSTNPNVVAGVQPGQGGDSSILLPSVPIDEVPEPATLVLLGAGLLSAGFARRRARG